MVNDSKRPIDNVLPMPGDNIARRGKDRLKQLTEQMEREEFGLLGDDFTDTRAGFKGLYQSLREAGQTPVTDGALHPPGHPNVDLMPNGDVFGSYKDLGAYLKSRELSKSRKQSKESGVMGFEKHHLLEQHWMKYFGFSEDELPCVALYQNEHMQLAHGEEGIAKTLPRVGKSDKGEKVSGILYDIDTLVDMHTEAYQQMGRSEWAERLRGYVRDNRQRIIKAYADGTVPWATPKAVARVRRYLQQL